MPLPSLHAANSERMKVRFEEAKQRMNMMHQRAMDSGLIGRVAGANPGFNNVRSSFEDVRDGGYDQVNIAIHSKKFAGFFTRKTLFDFVYDTFATFARRTTLCWSSSVAGRLAGRRRWRHTPS
jgi:hypothetical protein